MSYDIQDLLRSVQGGAPAPHTTTDDIIVRAKRGRARRTAAAATAGIAACLGIVLAVGSLPGGAQNSTGTAGQPVASAPTGPVPTEKPLPVKPVDFSTTLGTYRAGHYQVGPAGQVTAGYQEIPVYRDGETWPDESNHVNYPYAGAIITVYRPGVYDPGSFTFGEDTTLKIGERYTVKIGERPALAVDFTYLQPDNQANRFVRTALAWQYQDGAWATLVPQYDNAPLSRAEAAQIAAGLLTTAKKQQLKVPYRIGYLPTGWQAVAVTQTPAQTSSSMSALVLHQGPLANPGTRVDESVPGTVSIGVAKAKPKGPLHPGLNCAAGQHECTIVAGAYLISVGSWTVPDATVRKIAEGLQVKDFADQNTWITPNA